MKRILKVNYRKVNVRDLTVWLNANDYRYELVHGDNHCQDIGKKVIGTLTLALELFTDEAETATRLKWNIE